MAKEKKSDFLGNLSKITENPYASLASDGTSADIVDFVDTGSYALNALYSGSIFGGMPANKINALAGEESTGKCARGSQKLVVYMDEGTAKKLGLE